MFKLEILDELKEENHIKDRICYLAKGNLKDFIQSLPMNFSEYEIQREIVNNIYLDNLIDTVLDKNHIPAILLVSDKITKKEELICLDDYKILDGLQRTYRLKIIWDTFEMLKNKLKEDDEILNYTKLEMARKLRKDLSEINSSSIILFKIISFIKNQYNNDIISFEKSFFTNKQWFEIWTNLSLNEEVEKMLISNAGHKQVSIRHQLELLFLNLLPQIKEEFNRDNKRFNLIREKEMSTIRYSKLRQKGDFHFSIFISAIISFIKKETVIVNSQLVNEIQKEFKNNQDNYQLDSIYEHINYNFLYDTINFLVELDNYLFDKYQDVGVKWIAKESVLIGLFAALGETRNTNKIMNPKEIYDEFMNILKNTNDDVLNLQEYNIKRNELDASRINVGMKTKTTVLKGITHLMNKKLPIHWTEHFGEAK